MAKKPALRSPQPALKTWVLAIGIALLSLNCIDSPAKPPLDYLKPGVWRAVLASPGGELPFSIRVIRRDGVVEAKAINDVETVDFTSVTNRNGRIILRVDGYDSEIEATPSLDSPTLSGRWRKVSPKGFSELAFKARYGDERRFVPAAPANGDKSEGVGGNWQVTFNDDDGDMPARGEFVQVGSKVTGTFLTPIGDYRFLEGDFHEGKLRLSCFDGAHAFLFKATQEEDGSLTGDFWSRDSYHSTWTAVRLEEGERDSLPDPYQEVTLTNQRDRFAFDFPDLEGRRVTDQDERFKNKVLIVNIFGSWCPNCNDEAPLLAQWHRRYRERGLETVGLAYEYSGDAARDRVFVGKFAERHGIEYPLLLAGTSDKSLAAATLPDLNRVRSYPTTIFVGRDGRVRRIHSGFAGPATGRHHRQLVGEFESLIQQLLAE